MRKILLYLMLATFLLTPISLSKVVVINSQDWTDVYSGIMYADYNDLPSTFLNSESPDSVLKTIKQNEEIMLIESSTKPYIPGFENLLIAQGYEVETRETDRMNLDPEFLDELNLDKYILVEESYPYNAIIVAPYAELTNSWVFIVNDENVGEVTSRITNAENVLAVGMFKNSIKDPLEPYITETISTESKFGDSIEIANKFIEKRPTKQVLITDARRIETELISGSNGASPVLLVGPNLLPEETTSFLKENNIKTAVITGNQLSVVGESIRTATNRETVVFIKFGVGSASGTETEFSALTMFDLPSYTAKLTTQNAFYSPSQQKLFIKFNNLGDIGVFEFTSFTIKASDEQIAKGTDEEPKFIGGGETHTAQFDVAIPSERLSEELEITLYTSYGENPNSLENYITETGKYGPPLTIKLEIEEIEDNADVELVALNYYKNSKKFGIQVKNNGPKAFVDAELPEVEINGIEQTINYESQKELAPGEETELLIPAQLTELEVRNLNKQKVRVYYGEDSELLINRIEQEMDVTLQEDTSGLTGLITGMGNYGIGIVVLVILIIAFLFWKKKK